MNTNAITKILFLCFSLYALPIFAGDCTSFTVAIDGTCQAICAGGTLTLTAEPMGGSGDYTYLWTAPNGSTSTENPLVITGAVASDAGEYFVTVTDTITGCMASANTCVFISSIFTRLLPATQSVCANATATITGHIFNETPPYTASLYTSSSVMPIEVETGLTDNAFTFTVAPSTSTTYYVQITDAAGCTATTNTVEVLINAPIEPAVTLFTVSCDQTITVTGSGACPGQTVDLFEGPVQVAVPQIVKPNGTFSLTSIALEPGTYPAGTLSIETVDCNGCGVNLPLAGFTINEPVTVSIIADNIICQHVPYTLTASAMGGVPPYTYSWTGPNGYTATGPEATIPNPRLVNSGNYTVTAIDSVGCPASDSQLILVDAVGVSLSISPDFVCGTSSPTEATLTASIASGTEPFVTDFYQVATPPILIGTTTTTTASPVQTSVPVIPPFVTSGPSVVQYYATVSDNNGCSVTSNTVSLDVNNPKQPIITSAAALCTPQIAISGTGGAGNTVTIYNDYGTVSQTQVAGPLVVPNTGIFSITSALINPITNPYELTAVASNSFDCISTSTQFGPITLYPSLSVTITPASPINVCPGCSQTLTAHPVGGSGSYDYQWYFGSGEIIGATDSTYTISAATPADAGTYHIMITDNDRVDTVTCTAVATAMVNITSSALSGPSNICVDGTGNLTVTVSNNTFGTPPYNFYLFSSASPDPIMTALDVPSAQHVFSIGQTSPTETYYVQVTSVSNPPGSCCSVESAPITILLDVVNAPTITSTVVNCNGSITLTGTGTPGDTITVLYAGGTVETPVLTNGTFVVTTGALNLGTYTLNVTQSDANGCISPAVPVVVTVSAFVTAIPQSFNACANTMYFGALRATTSAGLQVTGYTITTAPAHGNVTGPTATGAFNYIPYTNYIGNDQFQFTATDSNGCTSAPAIVMVTVYNCGAQCCGI